MNYPIRILLAAALAIGLTSANTLADDTRELAIFPAEISLNTSEHSQQIVVQWRQGEQFLEQAHGATLASSNSDVVRIKGGKAVPVADGEAEITATVGDSTAAARVTVSGQQEEFTFSFRNHVESVLSKAGCNGGACHGARAGKNGFRLTLFGFDLEADHTYLTRQALGRRINLRDPGRSLLLTKPTGLLPHKGGIRFEPDSHEYRVLAEWIAAGAPGPAESDARIERLEVLPKYSQQVVGAKQQLILLAHFSDGTIEDVTRWAKYDSTNTSVATVDGQGHVEVTGPGEGAIKLWYLNQNVLAFVSAPYPGETDWLDDAPKRNFIDELASAKLRALNLLPSPLCDDATFIRRAYLDTIGILPTAEETTAFVDNSAFDKRDKLIETLLARPEFVDYWSYIWSDLLLVSGQRLRPKAVTAYYGWIRSHVEKNTPWDALVRELVTASGNALENGAANFYALHQEPTGMTETVAQAFMSLSLNCAKCHNHPLEKWTNDQYYGMANMFSRVRAKGWGGDFRNGEGDRVIFSDTQGELIQPASGKPQPPRPLDAEPLSFDDPSDRRVALAKWLTSPENPYFTRSIVNRVWARYFAVGLVEKVDDLRETNPASNEELLAAAANYLIENEYDLKQLMRAILQSSTYQRSSVPTERNVQDERFYSRYYPRRLPAEVMLDALSQVTSVPTKFKDHDAATRALQLPDANVESYFLSTFGRPERLITCDCERSSQPSMTQVLHIYNGDTLNAKLQEEKNRIGLLLSENKSDEEVLSSLYVEALAREPNEREKANLLPILAEAKGKDRRLVVEDLFWSVLSSREFLFNH